MAFDRKKTGPGARIFECGAPDGAAVLCQEGRLHEDRNRNAAEAVLPATGFCAPFPMAGAQDRIEPREEGIR